MKRFLSLLIVVVLAVTCIASAATAAAPVVSVSSATAAPGETVTLNVSLSNNPGFATYRMGITYDESALQLQSIDAGALSVGVFVPNVNNGMVSFVNVSDITGDGVLFTVTFKVIATAATTANVGINMDVSNLGNAAADRLSFSVSGNVVNIYSCAGGHTWGNWVVTKKATCTAAGAESRTCSVCQSVETRAISALGHKWSKWTVSKKATCTETGVESRTCANCNKIEVHTLAATGHNWSEWAVTTPATCTTDGVETRTCGNCGEAETRAIAAQGHVAGEEWLYDETGHWHKCSCGEAVGKEDHDLEWVITKEATDKEAGLKHQECKTCGWRSADVEIPATGAGDSGNLLWIIIAIALALILIFFIIIILIKRKKKEEEVAANEPEMLN